MKINLFYFLYFYILQVKCKEFQHPLPYYPLFLFHIVSSDGRNCTAVVINENFLLTVASCISEPIRVYGDSSINYSVQYIKRHPNFHFHDTTNKFRTYDLAIVKLGFIGEIYRALPVENLHDFIFGRYIVNCEIAYWFSEADNVHKDIRRITFKHLQVG